MAQGFEQKQGDHPVYTGAQRVLRFASLLYLGWYILTVAGAGFLAAARLLLGKNVPALLAAAPLPPEVMFANAILFLIDVACNLCFAVCAWMTSNHPSIAKRFRIFAGVLLAISFASLVYSIVFGQAAATFSNFYSCVIVGFLFFLAHQIVGECRAGLAVDFQDLLKTKHGRHLRTESQIERAMARGELTVCNDTEGQVTPESGNERGAVS